MHVCARVCVRVCVCVCRLGSDGCAISPVYRELWENCPSSGVRAATSFPPLHGTHLPQLLERIQAGSGGREGLVRAFATGLVKAHCRGGATLPRLKGVPRTALLIIAFGLGVESSRVTPDP